MILSQLNPFKFYADKRARQCEKTPQDAKSFAFYPTGQVPKFQVMVDKIAADDANYNWAFELYDESDVLIPTTVVITAGGLTGLKTLTYAGEVLPDMTDGGYYFKLFNTIESYYSDIFAWSDNTDSLLKISTESSPLRVGGVPTYLNAVPHTFYLNTETTGIKPKIAQSGDNQNAIDIILFGNRAITREFEIDASSSIYIFLSALPLINCNGKVTVTFEYETFIAADILVEELTNHGDGLYQIKLSFVDESETVGVING